LKLFWKLRRIDPSAIGKAIGNHGDSPPALAIPEDAFIKKNDMIVCHICGIGISQKYNGLMRGVILGLAAHVLTYRRLCDEI